MSRRTAPIALVTCCLGLAAASGETLLAAGDRDDPASGVEALGEDVHALELEVSEHEREIARLNRIVERAQRRREAERREARIDSMLWQIQQHREGIDSLRKRFDLYRDSPMARRPPGEWPPKNARPFWFNGKRYYVIPLSGDGSYLLPDPEAVGEDR